MIDADAQQMMNFKQGDSSAFDFLVMKYTDKILNLIYKYTGNHALAEDLTQEVFLRVFKSRDTYEPRAKFSTWLYRISVNVALNSLRSSKDKVYSSGDLSEGDWENLGPAGHSGGLSQMEESEMGHEILKALSHLPTNQRMALVLNLYEELPYKEIATILDTSYSMVKWLIYTSKQTLRKTLHSYIEKGISLKIDVKWEDES